MQKLTPKQKAFADAYIECGNASEAARRAGYKAKNADVTGAENLRKPGISAYISERMAAQDKKRVASADEVLRFFSAVLRGEEKDQFGLDATLSDRLNAGKELLKRYDAAGRSNADVAPAVNIDGALFENMADVFIPVHRDLAKTKHAEYWMKGGRASTKSSFISLEIIRGIREDEDANAVAFRRVGNTIKDSVYEQLVWAIDVLGVSDEFTLRKSPLEIIRNGTGQRILFRGADDPMKSKSLKLSKGYFKYLWFEELAEFRGMDDVRTIKQSVFRGVDHGITLYSYNPPKSAQNWVNSEALKQRDDRLVHHSTYLDVPREWLKDAFIAEAEITRETNERAYRNEYLGEVTGTGGNVFENVTARKITDEELNALSYFYQGIDWGWYPDPFHWVRCGYDAKARKLYISDEFRANKLSNAAAYEQIKDRLTIAEPLTADSAEVKSVSDFREFGAGWIRPAVKGPGSVDYSMKWLAALSEIVIDSEKCPAAAAEFLKYEYERNPQGEIVAGYVDKDNHAIDAVRYAMSPVWRRRGE